jgi:type II secretory pathway component PulM
VNTAWIEPYRSRWNALGARERRALSALAVFFGAVLFYLMIWAPIESGLARSRVRLASAQAQLAQVQAQAALVASIRAAPRADASADAASLVQEAAERNGLREQVKRVDADGTHSVRVQIEGVSFPALMALLVELQQAGLRAEDASLDRHANPGTINARIRLQARGG